LEHVLLFYNIALFQSGMSSVRDVYFMCARCAAHNQSNVSRSCDQGKITKKAWRYLWTQWLREAKCRPGPTINVPRTFHCSNLFTRI